MGGSSSAARTPRSIQITVGSSGQSQHSGGKDRRSQQDDCENLYVQELGDTIESPSETPFPTRQMSTIQEEGGDSNGTHSGHVISPTSKTPIITDRTGKSRCDSVQDSRSTREMTLKSVTPSTEMLGDRDVKIERMLLSGTTVFPDLDIDTSEMQNEKDHDPSPENRLNKITVLFEKMWTGNAPNDSLPCWVHGIATLAEGYVLILDLNNNKLKLFDESFQFCSDISVSEESQGISSVYSKEVAVTCGSEIRFYFIDKAEFILQNRCFKLNGQGFGISFNKNNYAVTCDIHRGGGSVRILSEKGKQRYVIKSCKIFGSVLKISKYIQIDTSSDMVYIPDTENGRVVCITFEGQALWEINVGDEPKGIQVINDFLVVAVHREHFILQMSSDGEEKRVVLTDEDDIWNPEYIMYNQKTGHLMVTSPENILIFKLL